VHHCRCVRFFELVPEELVTVVENGENVEPGCCEVCLLSDEREARSKNGLQVR
jgi:hypothetical protein